MKATGWKTALELRKEGRYWILAPEIMDPVKRLWLEFPEITVPEVREILGEGAVEIFRLLKSFKRVHDVIRKRSERVEERLKRVHEVVRKRNEKRKERFKRVHAAIKRSNEVFRKKLERKLDKR